LPALRIKFSARLFNRCSLYLNHIVLPVVRPSLPGRHLKIRSDLSLRQSPIQDRDSEVDNVVGGLETENQLMDLSNRCNKDMETTKLVWYLPRLRWWKDETIAVETTS